MIRENNIATAIVDAAYKIHKAIGPGLLESAYEAIFKYELEKRDHIVLAQVPIPVVYESVYLDMGFRADLIVDNLVIATGVLIEPFSWLLEIDYSSAPPFSSLIH
jgi:GxxExxY protein